MRSAPSAGLFFIFNKNCTFDSCYLLVKVTMKKILVFLLFALLAVSCSKESYLGDNEKEEIQSDNCNLSLLKFDSAHNPGLKVSVNGIINSNVIYVTVNDGVNLSQLVPTFGIDAKATAKVGDKVIESAKSQVDFSKTVDFTVVAQSGKKKNYQVLVQHGNVTVDTKVYNFMKKYSIPGISFAVSKNEEIVYAKGYGFANVEAKERTTSKHLFRLASVSKQQTAIAIMYLVEKGKLKLSDKLFGEGGIFEAEFGKDIPATAKSVTVRNFLEHNSGWVSNPDPMFTTNSNYDGKSVKERMAYVLYNVPQTYPVGSTYSYYNLGYSMLGMVIEKISGKDFETFLKENIYSKCGITDIHVGKDLKSQKRENECVFYSQSGSSAYNKDFEVIKACGGMIASTEELMRFLWYFDYRPKYPDFLKKETLDIMYTPSANYQRYCLGWRMNHSIFTNWAAYHTGDIAGTAAVWSRGKNGVNAVILCNSRSYIESFDADFNILLNDCQVLFY